MGVIIATRKNIILFPRNFGSVAALLVFVNHEKTDRIRSP